MPPVDLHEEKWKKKDRINEFDRGGVFRLILLLVFTYGLFARSKLSGYSVFLRKQTDHSVSIHYSALAWKQVLGFQQSESNNSLSNAGIISSSPRGPEFYTVW